ncbi:MAG: PKD domain-containing protein, partial [Kiritimatiellia bacterium]
MNKMRRNMPLLTLALLWLSQPVNAGWQLPAAECRRELKVEGTGSALVTATTTVFLDDRSSGFILIDAQNKPRPFALLNCLGSRVSIHFEAMPGESFSLYPLAATALPPPVIVHRSGLLHQTRTYNGSEVKSAEEFNQLWESATPQGGSFEEHVYSASNPFGPNTNTLHRYDGMLRITKPGVTTFCVASTDASFLLINDRLVASWPGLHSVADGLDGSKRGLLDLQQPGGYRFTYLHANSGANSFAIAAMIAPGEKQHFVIGPEFFSSAAYAFVGPLIGRDGAPQADFIWENRHMITIRDHRLYDMLFEAPAFKEDPAATYQWEFGDNTRASGAKVEHLVFADGDFPVTLTVTSKGRKSICCQTIRVAPRYGQSEGDDNRALALLERAVRQEKERGIQPEGYAL